MNIGEELKGSWRTNFGYRFLSSFDFEGEQIIELTIKKVTKEMAIDPGTKKEKELVSLSFDETDRLMALNATNAKKLTEMYNTPIVSNWKGKKLRIHAVSVFAFGKKTKGIRVV